jgi:catechol 2,3-dioxygenase-like lactoylglutathione lyase family enzyme
MPATLPMAPAIRFHLSLNVSNLARSIEFYRVLFGAAPAKRRDDYAKFELDDPPVVLSLEPSGGGTGGTLNHLGFRMPNAAALVAMQRRLGEAGITSRREEGVECCYARQTKFWVTDPDNTLWEIYTLDEDIEHRGPGQALADMLPQAPPAATSSFEHRLSQPFPEKLAFADASLDEVRLRGTLNQRLAREAQERVLQEALRVLRPDGRLFVHVLVADRTPTGPLHLPGPASAVQHTPLQSEPFRLLEAAGLQKVRVLKLDATPCFTQDGVEMHELQLEGRKPPLAG